MNLHIFVVKAHSLKTNDGSALKNQITENTLITEKGKCTLENWGPPFSSVIQSIMQINIVFNIHAYSTKKQLALTSSYNESLHGVQSTPHHLTSRYQKLSQLRQLLNTKDWRIKASTAFVCNDTPLPSTNRLVLLKNGQFSWQLHLSFWIKSKSCLLT